MRYDPPSAAKASPFGDAARSADYTHHVIVILIVSFIARLVAVRFLDLTFMETYGAVVARNPSISFFDQPPLTWWTIAGVMRLFGSDDAVIVRLPFLVMSVVSGWLIYLITLRIFNSRAGLYAVCAYSLSPLLGLSDGSLAQTNGPMTLFILAALLAFLHIDFGARRLQDNGIWFACAFLFGCALASKYLAVLLVPGLLVAVASQAEGRRWLLRPATYFGLVFLLLPLLPVIIWNAEHGWVSFLYQGARAEGNGSVNLTRAFRWTLTQVMIVHPLVFFPAFYMLYRSLRNGPREAGPWLLACLAAPVLLFILGVMVWSSHPLRGYHWASMGYLPLLPLVGAWADGLAASDRPDAARRWLATLAATTILAIGLLLLHAFTGWAERVAPAKAFRNQDPILLELYDWSDLPSALTARGVDPARTFIAATRWEDCAKAFYAIRQQFRSLCLAGDNIHFTYLADPARFRGMDAIIVDRYANPDAIRYNLDGHFETFSEDSPIRPDFQWAQDARSEGRSGEPFRWYLAEAQDRRERPPVTLTLPQATFAPDADRPLVTIVIPTFNERDNIAVICGRIAASLDRHPFEVIVVDDDSPDGTSAVVESLAKADSRIRIITRTGRRGLAGACIEGMLAARSELVAVMDADLQHEPATLVPMLDLMASTKCDIVIASRYVDDPDVAAFSSVRQALSNAGNRLVRALLRVQTSDPMSGFFLMRRSIVVKAEPRLSRDGFKLLADILVQGGRAMKIEEVPYVFGPRLTGQSKLDERVLFDFAVLLIAKSVFGALPTRFVSFALVGGLGVIVHLALLGLMLYVLNDNFLLSQTVATLGAMTANFFLNNVLTYRDQRIVGIDLLRGLAVFCLSCSCGAFNNILVAHLIYTATGIWWLATGVGILVGAACNYVLSALTVWRRFDKRKDREKQAPEGDAVLSKGGGDIGIAQPPYVSR